MNDEQIELEIQAKGLDAPRVDLHRIEQVIVGEDYHQFPDTTLTICCLTLANGFTVTGESACVSLENFDPELGRKIARENAKQKIWALEGYLLRDKLRNGGGDSKLVISAEGMPRYKCHKEVAALKITDIDDAGYNQDGDPDGYYLMPDDKRFAPIFASVGFMQKHMPEIGGYLVVYADGYCSYSPAKAFEEGYTLIAS